jgi:hypothetical protein
MGKEAIPQVVIDSPRNPLIAEMVAASLMERGIPAFVEGRSLQDPYAVTQRALGNLAVQVIVPGEFAEDARKILDDLRLSSDSLENDAAVTQDAVLQDEHVDEQDLEAVV